MRNRFERLRRDQRGNVLPMFGLAMVPLIGIIGATIDYNRATKGQVQLQAALDQAALMVARDPPEPDAAVLMAKVERMMTAQLAGTGVTRGEWSFEQPTDINGRIDIRAESMYADQVRAHPERERDQGVDRPPR